MNIVRDPQSLETLINKAKEQDRSIGFVPTMGGLHAGHLSLIERCRRECQVCVVSLFLNPTQFNDPKDYETYPHNPKADEQMLEQSGVDIVFAPSPEKIYDEGEEAPTYDLGQVAEVMEGAYRPGHFRGVVWIVSKLFRLVRPDRAYFGEKDFQQIAVIRKMISLDQDFAGITIVPCPVIREADGLAMSSRNARLSEAERAVAGEIYRVLQQATTMSSNHTVAEVHDFVVKEIDAVPHLRVEYFSIVDAVTLSEVSSWDSASDIVGCITVYCGQVRLIDHIHFHS